MESDSSGSGVRAADGPRRAGSPPSRTGSRGSDSFGGVPTPERMDSIGKGIKILFTLFLTTLLVYWFVAFYFGVVLFEF